VSLLSTEVRASVANLIAGGWRLCGQPAEVSQPRLRDLEIYGQLKRLVNSRGNSVVLHESYFDGLAPEAVDPAASLRRAIEQRFGSVDLWAEDFIASAKEAAGWGMLVKHPVNGKLYNVVSDEHAMGVLWMARPIIVIDTYEHAFYVDYQNRKAEYVEKFMDHIDWSVAAERYTA
jgi:Fe-Mn family superoxide dismutase